MKKILLFSIILLFSFSNLIAQKPFYHKNKNIGWVGQTEFTYYLENYDRLNFEPSSRKQEETRTIKIDPYATCDFGNEKYFTNFIINEVLEGRRNVTTLKGKKMQLSEVQNAFGVASIDTTFVVDPVTGKSQMMVIQSDPKYQINAFKIKQWWYFDKEKESLGSMVRAIAPIIFQENEYGVVTQQPLFWIEMQQDYKKQYHYNDESL